MCLFLDELESAESDDESDEENVLRNLCQKVKQGYVVVQWYPDGTQKLVPECKVCLNFLTYPY